MLTKTGQTQQNASVSLKSRLSQNTTGDANANPLIPSGFVYLAQLVAHDLTRPSSDRGEIQQPCLDLSCLYGGGPVDLRHGDLYNGAKLRLGRVRRPGDGEQATGPFKDVVLLDGKRSIVDDRNDENLLVSQLSVLWGRFHNFIVDELNRSPGKEVLSEYRQEFESKSSEVVSEAELIFRLSKSLVVYIYQSIITEQLIPLLTNSDVNISSATASSTDMKLMLPLGVYSMRACHSMVRSSYHVNESHLGSELATLRKLVGSRNRTSAITEDWIVDWRWFFFDTSRMTPEKAVKRKNANYALRIGPEYRLALDVVTRTRRGMSLTQVDQERDGEFGKITGQDAAKLALKACKLSSSRSKKLSYSDILSSLESTHADEQSLEKYARETPLLPYLQCESAVKASGTHFGVVGSVLILNTITYAINNSERGHPELRNWASSLSLPSSMRDIVDVCW